MESICFIPLMYKLKNILYAVDYRVMKQGQYIVSEELYLSYVMYSLKIKKQKSKIPCHASLVYSFVIERKKYS